MSVNIQFDETLFDNGFFNLGAATGSPEFANDNSRSPQTGITKVAILRQDPQIMLNCDFQDISHPDPKGLQYLNNIWYGGFASAYGLRVLYPADCSTTGEVIATGDNSTKDFKLTKTYNRPGTSGHPYIRRIIKPVAIANLASGSVTLNESDGSTARARQTPSPAAPTRCSPISRIVLLAFRRLRRTSASGWAT